MVEKASLLRERLSLAQALAHKKLWTSRLGKSEVVCGPKRKLQAPDNAL